MYYILYNKSKSIVRTFSNIEEANSWKNLFEKYYGKNTWFISKVKAK